MDNQLTINQECRQQSRHKLYICTIYPDIITPEMMFNTVHLGRSKRLEIEPIFIRAGYFSHRHRRDVPDPEQIRIRQMYLDKVPVGEWLLVLDSDEIILAPPDNLADMLDYLEVNTMHVGMIAEFRSDGDLKGRPRLIKKKANLKYGGPEQKHDVIWCSPKHDDLQCEDGCEYCDHIDGKCYPYGHDHELSECPKGYNYIDVNNEKTAMDLPIFFYHVKTASKFVFFHNEDTVLQHPEWVVQKEIVEQ